MGTMQAMLAYVVSVWVGCMACIVLVRVQCLAQQARNAMLRSAEECCTEETVKWVISFGGKLYVR